MTSLLSCYFIDAALDDDELNYVSSILTGPWARFRTHVSGLRQQRVPAVLPLPDANGCYNQSREELARRVRAHLRHAGIQQDHGRRVLWISPPDRHWDAIFQHAILSETGFGAFVAQRWNTTSAVPVRETLRVIDTDLLRRGL